MLSFVLKYLENADYLICVITNFDLTRKASFYKSEYWFSISSQKIFTSISLTLSHISARKQSKVSRFIADIKY